MTRSFDPVQLGSIELFCRAAELQGFTAAAQALGVTAAAVSRSVGRLEARLGVRLFTRTTRSIRLTDAGQAYFVQCRQALAQIAEAERAVTGSQVAATGLLRISVPTTYGHHRLLPLLPKFAQAHPDVQLEVSLSNRNIDFVEEGYDLAIRMGEPQDSRLVSRKLEDAKLGVFAAPKYLRWRGTPRSLVELLAHDCIQFVLPSSGRGMAWIFRENGADVDFSFTSQMQIEDDVLGCVSYARAGGGLFQIYDFIAQPYVKSGELIEVLKPLRGRARSFTLLYPHNRYLSAKVRAFNAFLLKALGKK
jgi:DNA-binding transcriptional LysR family regulator